MDSTRSRFGVAAAALLIVAIGSAQVVLADANACSRSAYATKIGGEPILSTVRALAPLGAPAGRRPT